MPKRWIALAGACVLWLAGSAGADLSGELQAALKRGQYEDVIQRATEAIEAAETPPEDLLFLRGMAAYRIAWFGQAQADLSALPGERWPDAATVLERLERAREVAPAHVAEIKGRSGVLFRVYYDVNDKWTGTLMGALPDVFGRVTGFYGVQMAETAVFVFADKDRHGAFIEALTGEAPHDWAWASGGNGMLIFCPYAPGNDTRESPSQLPETAAHEFSHCLLHRALGNTRLPLWLDEGLAMNCAALVRPQKNDENDIYLTRMWTAGQILPLRIVTSRDTFYDPGIAANAYVQAFAMVRFLISDAGRDGLMAILNQVKQDRSVESAMDQLWNGGLNGFYEDWLAATERRVEKFK